ncbi:hypothetical protein [Taibaiella koreensis]|uniref:hypothetical protein n=1 Tax=Taibaiella koreensis TaxID=1268548 RepID=UPI000E59DCAD|nr:hypothetical protein [Taibaiella koreensis]
MHKLIALISAFISLHAYGQKNEYVPNIKAGYTSVNSELGSKSLEIGYYHCSDGFTASSGPSATLVALFNEHNKVRFGPKIGYELQVYCLAGKVDISYVHPYLNLTPAAGLSVFGWASAYIGYNVCFTDSKMSGFYTGIFLNMNMGSRPAFNLDLKLSDKSKAHTTNFYASRIGN